MAVTEKRTPNVMLTVVIRDETPVRYVNEPPTYRTVHVVLTPEQLALLALDENENIGTVFLESALTARRA